MWARLEYPMDTHHIVPVDDLKEHEDGYLCWCQPNVQKFPNGNTMVTHNAADFREFYEQEAPTGH